MYTTGDLLPIVFSKFVSPRHDKQTAAQAAALHRLRKELSGRSLTIDVSAAGGRTTLVNSRSAVVITVMCVHPSNNTAGKPSIVSPVVCG
jgi:hypothetical protein